ncbi:uncharacterized protein J7T54_003523 [Emericellopsis cladophorae]|uniref:Uncharacterized protein n=1 Tax=Emericellopsis cladophorae TaxID=2686198 RepID=A0A9P9XTZ7_9HYPO|nr:uncharacterized protein J7T54_003523 [Emericellopsis cladophorae]KAI6777715.1 hypothetical protein J7T54_003523 [Emericellopsis cladophorae]
MSTKQSENPSIQGEDGKDSSETEENPPQEHDDPTHGSSSGGDTTNHNPKIPSFEAMNGVDKVIKFSGSQN